MATQQTSFIDLPSLYSYGLYCFVYMPKQVVILPGRARSQFNEFDITVSSNLIVNLAINGVNGLDTGTVAPNTWYALYLIYDNTLALPVAGLFSCQQLTTSNVFAPPVLPFGYSNYMRVAYVLTDSSSNVYPFQVAYGDIPGSNGNNSSRYFQFNTPVPVLSGGVSPTFSTVNLGAGVPYNNRGLINMSALCGSSVLYSASASIRGLGAGTALGVSTINLCATAALASQGTNYPSIWIGAVLMQGLFPAVEYQTAGGAALSLWVNGYYDSM